MQSREQTENPTSSRSDRRSIVPDRDATTLRPVALPALAAAVRGAAPVKRARGDAQVSARFQHEDTPLA